MQRALLFSLFAIFPFLSLSAGWAADRFGQQVPAALEARVEQARVLRLPFVDGYDPEKSATILVEVLKEKPDYYRALFNLGLAHHELNNYPEARSAFDRAIEIREAQDLNDVTVFNTAGWVSMKNGDFERAEELLTKAEELTRGEGSFTEKAVISNLGELYFLTQRFEDSKQYFAISRNRYNNESADFYLGVIEALEVDKSQP